MEAPLSLDLEGYTLGNQANGITSPVDKFQHSIMKRLLQLEPGEFQ
jgi:hypothetical protein